MTSVTVSTVSRIEDINEEIMHLQLKDADDDTPFHFNLSTLNSGLQR